MRKGGGKGKGSSFEREGCKKFSLWVSHGKRQDLFWRSAMSGGRATIGAKKGVDLRWQAGDMCAVHPDGHALTDRFYVEYKHYRDLELGRLVLGEGKLYRFWRETEKQARKHERLPMLVAKQNHTPTLVLTWTTLQPFASEPICEIKLLGTESFSIIRFDDMLRCKYFPL